VAEHEAGLRRLRGIGFDAGRSDGFRHLPASVRELSAALAGRGIRHAYAEYEGTHGSPNRERMRTRMLPFLSRHLAAPSR
jgi:S-formylglutathione hydrolase